MKIQKALISGFAVVLLSGIFVSGANAVSMDCIDNAGLPCTANAGDVLAGGVVVGNSGNDFEAQVEAAIQSATGMIFDLTLLGKSDQGGGYGTYNGGNPLPDGTLIGTYVIPDMAEFITVKAANSFNVFDVSGMTGNYDTTNILNNGGNQPGVSHISFWGAPTTPAVATPEPGTAFLLGSGLAGLGFWRWKTKK